MTGDAFITALEARLLPKTITNVNGKGGNEGMMFTISDGRQLTVKRRKVRDLDEAEVGAFLDGLLA